MLVVTCVGHRTRHESLLGFYEVPILYVCFGGQISGRRAEIVPRARYVAAEVKPPGEGLKRADGIVEIRSDAAPEYLLFRVASAGGDRWFIRSVNQWNDDPDYGTVEPLTSERFEAALLSILK